MYILLVLKVAYLYRLRKTAPLVLCNRGDKSNKITSAYSRHSILDGNPEIISTSWVYRCLLEFQEKLILRNLDVNPLLTEINGRKAVISKKYVA